MANTNFIGKIKKTTFKVDVRFSDDDEPIYDGWMDTGGNITLNETHHHVEVALKFIEEADKRLKHPHHMNDFLNANKNRGYDAAEFIIITWGYVAIEGQKVIYDKTTVRQRDKLGVRLSDEGDILIKDDSSSKEKAAMKERQWVIDNKEFYEDFRNRFHCPSGVPRVRYERWRALASKHGICTSTRRTYFTSYC